MGNFLETDKPKQSNQNGPKFGGYKNSDKPRPGYYVTPSEVYYRGQPIVSATPSTFKKLGAGWAKDKRFVYFQGKPVDGIDVSSFGVEGKVGRDKKSKWYRGKLVA